MSSPAPPSSGVAANDTRGADHGVNSAGYRHDLAPKECTIECMCGALCAGVTWQAAGRDLDAHLAEMNATAGERA